MQDLATLAPSHAEAMTAGANLMPWNDGDSDRATDHPAARSMARRGVLLGLCLAAVAAIGLHWPLRNHADIGLALFLALTACVYPGALLAQVRRRQVTVAELVVGTMVFVAAWLGLLYGAVWIAMGYGLHGIWDWLHHKKVVRMRISEWFPPACAVFDAVIAVYALTVV